MYVLFGRDTIELISCILIQSEREPVEIAQGITKKEVS